MREAPLRIMASASASGTRVAMPSARVLLLLVRTKAPHGTVLLDRIAMRHVDRHRHAIAICRVGDALAVIACRGRDQSGSARAFAVETVDIDQPAPHLEGAGRRVVLVLDDNRCAEPLRQ